MGKAKQPVSVAGIEFDALITEEKTLEATVPQYTVEDGFSVTDSILLSQTTLSMTLFVSSMPVTWVTKHPPSKTRVKDICNKLEDLYFKKQPVKIVTSDKTYKNMAITNISFKKAIETGYDREIPITFKEIKTTSSKTTKIPKAYAKSGKSKKKKGTAKTTSKTKTKTKSKSKSSSSSTKSKGKSSTSKKSSLMYSAGKSLGIIK